MQKAREAVMMMMVMMMAGGEGNCTGEVLEDLRQLAPTQELGWLGGQRCSGS